MEEPLTISKEAPEKKSMDYGLLREEGLKYIQNIAGKVWTDYNIHDPGITILEVLCYAITELGYRTSYDIKDIIARDPAKSNGEERHNFFTAADILPNAPVTKNDYRKLMIDVEVEDSANPGCKFAGVKNAWIEQAKGPEIDVYLNKEESKLTYESTPPGDEPLDLDILYNVLLEFDECEAYGDLNENKIVRDFTVTDQDSELEGLVIRVDVEFPRWDKQDIDWDDDDSLSQAIHEIEISFLNLEGIYSIEYELNQANKVVLSGTMSSETGPKPIDDLGDVQNALNEFIFEGSDSLIAYYREKIEKIKEIVEEVKATLHANRNLCEDFLKFNALRIEEILVCADIELELDADVEEVQARMYHEIAKFLSPTVYFYSLEEMLTRCYDEHRYDITSINIDSNVFTIDAELGPMPEQDSIVAVTGSNNNNGTYTVQQARLNRDDETRTDIFVEETIPSGILTEGEKLYIGNPEEDQCTPTEKIFEGPLLDHGFIDDEELARADRKKKIHVSDLIQIIMDVPGVVAVKNIQIANDPQGNGDETPKSESVRWCLDLAFDQNYVPRLNTDDSKITFYKDQLPYRADQQQVDEIIEDLENEERSQKLGNPVLDIKAPRGEYKNLEDYESIQNEFPLVYGIGEEGVPSNPGNPGDLPTKAHARQLKGFLMFFDQLLANYLSQLAHVKHLFSMNPQKNEFGNFEVGRTYYTQPLFDIVPNADELYIDKAGHEVTLDNIAESEEEFGDRRNRFLDHLMARFAEQFTDYALLTYRISGPKAQNELIEDKLAFLNSYPEISANRGQAFNYKDPCEIWHIDNASGLEKRASMLVGIEERDISELTFSPRFKIKGSEPNVTFSVENDDPKEILTSSHSFETVDKTKEVLEKVIVNGVYKEKFSVKTDEDSNYFFELICDDEVIAESVKKDFADEAKANQAIDEVIQLLTEEFFNNPESNRHNLAPPLDNYFHHTSSVDMVPDPPTYAIEYELYKVPFDFSADPVFRGSFEGEGDPKLQARVLNIDTGSSVFTVEGDIRGFLAADDIVVIEDSEASDGTYTISSFSKNGDDTDIKVDETIPSDEAPRGELHYNQVSKEELEELAESKVYDVLWNVVANGVSRDRYVFDSSASEYKFKLCDLSGNLLGESEASDFNVPVADEIENAADGVRISDDDQAYEVESTDVSGPNIEVEIDPAPSSPLSPDSQLYFTESFDLQEIDKEEQIFKVGVDLTEQLSNVNKIVISGSASNDGEYLIFDVSFGGTHSLIKVREAIPSETIDEEEDPKLEYTKSFEIIKAAGNKIIIKGGADEQAVADMIDFLISKFADHEGMHLVEHILLRPKVHENLFVDAEEDILEEGLAENGTLTFTKTYPIKSADRETKTFVIETDITSDLSSDGMKLRISDSKLSDGEFTIDSFSFNGTSTEIVVEEPLVASIEESSDGGNLSYEIDEEISAVSADEKKITITGNVASVIPTESILEITGSSGDKNDGRYTVLDATDEGSNTGITIKKVEDLIRDRLLAVNLGDECECVLEDPYTCVAHVVLPYWPGRFTNTDFRKFFDKTIRREAPAHVFLNICWVSPAHMADFERAYKAWLIENSRKKIDKVALSKTLEELIDSIEKLRNVYPEGTLHDCDEDENIENSIILNHSRTG